MRMRTRRAMRGIILLRRRVRRCALRMVSQRRKVVPGYQLSNPWFEYHPEDGLYYRYQYGGPHMGDEGQIAVKNIIFQYCLWKYYKPTEYLDIDVHTPATGYYFTNGHGILIRWDKRRRLRRHKVLRYGAVRKSS